MEAANQASWWELRQVDVFIAYALQSTLRPWLPRLYTTLTKKLKEKLELSSKGVTKKKVCKRTGKVRVTHSCINSASSTACMCMYYNPLLCTNKERRSTAEADPDLPSAVWTNRCQVPHDHGGQVLSIRELFFPCVFYPRSNPK